jgi:cation diffusion facilitator family transporter
MAAHGSKLVIYAALAGNGLIALSKFGAAWLTGSSAMVSEAIHSLVDTGNQVLLLHGIRQAAKPATPEHPFGFGLRLYFWTFVVAILIFGMGAGVAVVEGISKLRHPHPIVSPWVNYLVLGISLIFEAVIWFVAFRSFRAEKGERSWMAAIRSSKDPTVFTVLFEDSAAMAGLIIAAGGLAIGQWLDLPEMDGIASILIGLVLAMTGGFLAYESHSLMAGEGMRPEVRASIRSLAEAEPGVAGVGEILTMHFGPQDALVALSLDFEDAQRASEVEETVSRLEQRIRSTHPDASHVFIKAQNAKPMP